MQEIIQEALRSGYLSIEAENKLRQLLRTNCQPDDISAFMRLQRETMEGNVRQEARERLSRSQSMASEKPVAIAC